MTVRVLVVDDQAGFRQAMRTVVELIEGLEVCGEAATGLHTVDPDGEGPWTSHRNPAEHTLSSQWHLAAQASRSERIDRSGPTQTR